MIDGEKLTPKFFEDKISKHIGMRIKLHSFVVFFIILFLGYAFLLILSPVAMPEESTYFTEAFHRVTVGVGAILAGLAGIQYIAEVLEKRAAQRLIESRIQGYKKKFPLEEFGRDKRFRLVQPQSRQGTIYVAEKIDIDPDKPYRFYHVGNIHTFYDLGFAAVAVPYTFPDELFERCPHGETILTRGKVGE